MSTYIVVVTCRIPVDESPSRLPPLNNPFAALPQQSVREVDVQWPGMCPCCGAAPEPGQSLLVSQSRQFGMGILPPTLENWKVPYCSKCLAHLALQQQRPASSLLLETAVVAAAAVVVFFVLPVNALLAAVLFFSLLSCGVLMNSRIVRQHQNKITRQAMSNTCVCAGAALTFLGWNENRTQRRFSFQNSGYASTFAALNHSTVKTTEKVRHAS